MGFFGNLQVARVIIIFTFIVFIKSGILKSPLQFYYIIVLTIYWHVKLQKIELFTETFHFVKPLFATFREKSG